MPQEFFKSKLFFALVAMVAGLLTAVGIWAATTIGPDINTDGNLTVNGIGKINTGLQVGADITSPFLIDRTISNVSYMTTLPNNTDYWHIGQYSINQYLEGSADSATRGIGSINQVIVPITYTGNILAGDIWGSPALMAAENSVYLDGGTSVPLVVGTYSNISGGAYAWPVLGTNITEARSFMAYIPSSPGGGSIVNAVGLYIGDGGGPAGITNQYGVYIQGAKNYFAGNVGLGTMFPGAKLEVNGGLMLNTVTAKPVCDVAHRGTQWFTQSGAGVKDDFEVCAKDAADTYSWRTLY